MSDEKQAAPAAEPQAAPAGTVEQAPAPVTPGEPVTDPGVTAPQTPDDLEWGTVPATDPATGDQAAVATATGAATHVPVTDPAGTLAVVGAHPHLGISDEAYLAGLKRELELQRSDKKRQAQIQAEIDAVQGRIATVTPEETR